MTAQPAPCNTRRLLIAAMLLCGLIGFFGINPYLLSGGDNAAYVSQAEGLLTTGHPLEIYLAGSPSSSLKPALFPVLLAGVEALFGRSVIAMKGMIVMFAIASVWAAWFALRNCLSEPAENQPPEERAQGETSAVAIALWFALTPTLTLYAHDILSDVPFTFVTLLAMGFCGRAVRKDARPSAILPVLVLFLIAEELRTAGTILMCACGLALAVQSFFAATPEARRQIRIFALILAATAAALLWYTQRGQESVLEMAGATVSSGTPADDAWSRLAARAQDVLRVGTFYALFLSGEVAGYDGFSPAYMLLIFGVPLALVGMIALYRRRQVLIPTCWLLYQGALLFWPYIDRRYFLPVLPLFMCMIWTGARLVLSWLAGKGTLALAIGVFLVCLCPVVAFLGTFYSFGFSRILDVNSTDWLVAAALLAGAIVALTTRIVSKNRGESAARPLLGPMLNVTLGVFIALAGFRSLSENVVQERQRSPDHEARDWGDFYYAGEWLKVHAKSGDIAISGRPSLIWLWSGLQGAAIPRLGGRSATERELQAARWAVVDSIPGDSSSQYLEAAVEAQGTRWSRAWTQHNTTIYRRND